MQNQKIEECADYHLHHKVQVGWIPIVLIASRSLGQLLPSHLILLLLLQMQMQIEKRKERGKIDRPHSLYYSFLRKSCIG